MNLIIAPRAKNVERKTREKRGKENGGKENWGKENWGKENREKENLRRPPTEGTRRSAENQFFRNVRSSLTLCSAAMPTKVG